MERELMLTGVGGQGVQLAAQVLGRAATLEGRHAMVFGVYSGVMRGGNSDSTLVVSDGPIQAPPLISRTWSALAMHHEFWDALAPRVRNGGLVLVNSTVFEGALEPDRYRVIDVPATELASGLGNLMVGSMVMAGAYAGVTGIVGIDAAVEGMRESLPPYRQQHAALNADALRAGYDTVDRLSVPAWDPSPANPPSLSAAVTPHTASSRQKGTGVAGTAVGA